MRNAWNVTSSICCDLEQFNSQRVSAVCMSLLLDTIWRWAVRFCRLRTSAIVRVIVTNLATLMYEHVKLTTQWNLWKKNVYWAADTNPVDHEIPCFIWQSFPLVSILSQMNTNQTLLNSVPKIHFHITVPTLPGDFCLMDSQEKLCVFSSTHTRYICLPYNFTSLI